MLLVVMKAPCFAVLLVLVAATPVAALAGASGGATGTDCDEYLKTPLPPEALSIATPRSWPDCDSYKSYAGIGRKVDDAAARQCAWAERLAQQAGLEPRYTVASLFGGSAMLAVLYANGEGVEQNKPLALRFACEAELEGDGKSDILALPNEPHVTQKKFKYCDEVRTTLRSAFAPHGTLSCRIGSGVVPSIVYRLIGRRHIAKRYASSTRLRMPTRKRTQVVRLISRAPGAQYGNSMLNNYSESASSPQSSPSRVGVFPMDRRPMQRARMPR